jgi:hypothetical protein
MISDLHVGAQPNKTKKKKKEKRILLIFRFLTAAKSLFCSRSASPARIDYHLMLTEEFGVLEGCILNT